MDIKGYEDLSKQSPFNSEEQFLMNQIAYSLFSKQGYAAKFEDFFNDLEILQTGTLKEKLGVWLSCINQVSEKT